MKFRSYKAFTLIELLIVIIIIGILATALIPRFTGAQDKARYARVEKDFRDFRTAVFLAQANTNKPLKDITGTSHTKALCEVMISGEVSTIANFNKLDYNHGCRVRLRDSLKNIAVAAGMDTGALLSLELDPWGSPYLLDENEGDFQACGRYDVIFTAGSDLVSTGMQHHDNAIYIHGDDKGINIAPQGCPGAY